MRQLADAVLLRLTGTRARDWDPRLPDSVPARVAGAYGEHDIAEHAAALAFNALLSVFPVLVGLAFLVDRVAADPGLAGLARTALLSLFPPDAQADLHRTITGIRDSGGTFGLLTVASLLWGGSGLYAALETPLAKLYGMPVRTFWRQRLHGLVMVPLFTAAIAWSLAINGLAGTLPYGELVAFALGSMLLTGFSMRLYQLVPVHRYPLRMVFPGALFTGVSTELLGLALPVVGALGGDADAYGAGIGTVLLLATWLFLLSQILLVGACINRETQGRLTGALPLNVPLIPRSRLVLVFGAVSILVLAAGLSSALGRSARVAYASEADEELHCADAIAGTAMTFCTAGAASAAALPSVEGVTPTEAGLLDRLRARVLAKLAQRHGIILDRIGLEGLDLYLERTIPAADGALLRATLTADLAAVERRYGRSLADRPAVFAFGSGESFRGGLESLFGYPAATARIVSATSGGVLITGLRTIAINWAAVARERPVTILRHELSHTALRELTGPRDDVPAWLDEGLAALEQRSLSGADEARRQVAVAAAFAAGGTVGLERLTTRADWLRHAEASQGRVYLMAASAVSLLEADLGRPVILRLLERARAVPFEAAVVEVTGRTLADLTAGALTRIAAQAPAPQVRVARTAPGSLTWTATGLPPSAAGEAAIDGAGYAIRFAVRADTDGRVSGTFGQTATPGLYVLRLTFGPTILAAELDTR